MFFSFSSLLTHWWMVLCLVYHMFPRWAGTTFDSHCSLLSTTMRLAGNPVTSSQFPGRPLVHHQILLDVYSIIDFYTSQGLCSLLRSYTTHHASYIIVFFLYTPILYCFSSSHFKHDHSITTRCFFLVLCSTDYNISLFIILL